MNVEELKLKLESMSVREVREYSVNNYPELLSFHRGSKTHIIDKIVLHEENNEILDMIARRASEQ